jgi:hypothetical protein
LKAATDLARKAELEPNAGAGKDERRRLFS